MKCIFKKHSAPILLLILVCLCFLLPMAMAEEASLPAGAWAYPDEPGKSVLQVEEDGRILFENEVYHYRVEDGIGYLQPENAEKPALRIVLEDGNLILYRQLTYTRYKEDKTGEGFYGAWTCTTGGSYFIFKDNGQFLEDGVFAGTFVRDDDEGSFTLTYDGPFEDTKCFFRFDGEVLTVAYPWLLQPVQK